jgi:dolichol-phosphate mannosyltransferase
MHTTMTSNTSVIIPAHNEEETIGKMVRMLHALYHQYIREIIIVNDASKDKTSQVIRNLSKKIKCVKLINRHSPSGVGLALRDGLRKVSGKSKYVLTLDADFIRNLSDLEDFFLKIKDYDGLIGSRYREKNSLVNYPGLKKFFNRSFHLIARFLYGIKHKDLTNNFKLYKKEVFNSLPLSSDDYAINAETGLYPVLMGYNIGEIPVIWFARSRNMGVSKFKLFSVAPGYIKVLLRAFNIKKKVRSSL